MASSNDGLVFRNFWSEIATLCKRACNDINFRINDYNIPVWCADTYALWALCRPSRRSRRLADAAGVTSSGQGRGAAPTINRKDRNFKRVKYEDPKAFIR